MPMLAPLCPAAGPLLVERTLDVVCQTSTIAAGGSCCETFLRYVCARPPASGVGTRCARLVNVEPRNLAPPAAVQARRRPASHAERASIDDDVCERYICYVRSALCARVRSLLHERVQLDITRYIYTFQSTVDTGHKALMPGVAVSRHV